MDYEIEGKCPRCFKVMQDLARNLICDGKRYNFPFRLYSCDQHGIYVWRGWKHELFDLSKRTGQATSVEPLESEVMKRFAGSGHMPTLSDYGQVQIICPKCGTIWEEYGSCISSRKTVKCPSCSTEIQKEEAIPKEQEAKGNTCYSHEQPILWPVNYNYCPFCGKELG